MKKILGLDLGTNSIGWAVISTNDDGITDKIQGLGSRIIPMDSKVLGDFAKGNSKSQTAERTRLRGTRRLRERYLLRRERLHRVLNIIGFLPEHYKKCIGWNKNEPRWYGKFIDYAEPKIEWKKTENKYGFIFMDSFNEMLADFEKRQPELLSNGRKIPYDWTIYFLRKKALTEKISKEELAWIILNFNQKRGYYQFRGEDETKADRKEYVERLKIVEIENEGQDKKNSTRNWYKMTLENGWVYKAPFSIEPRWKNTVKEFLITEELNEEGLVKSDKEGIERRKLTILPSFDEIDMMSQVEKDKYYSKIKAKTELSISESGKTVGSYIYDTMLQKPYQKIRGKLVRTIERRFYKDELRKILLKQTEFHNELNDRQLYAECIDNLYENNDAYKNSIANHDFTYLFIDDIIFYQRPLKSKKSLISDCPFESSSSTDGKIYGIKCIARSHPLFQEFRIWKFISNLKIFQREKKIGGRIYRDADVTSEFLKSEEEYVSLFEWLNGRKEVDQSTLLGSYFKIKKARGKDTEYPYRWNYVEDKCYPCNETRYMIVTRLENSGIDPAVLTESLEERLWHILYSVDDRYELKKALKTFADKNGLNEKFIENFEKFPPFKKEYGSFSSKAIKKLLPLMRMGKYWSADAIDKSTRARIEKLLTGELDERIKDRVREKAINLTELNDYKALPEWLALYIIYGRFSEAREVTKWENPEQMDNFIKGFRQHSLRNPIVEQVILETLRTVHDIWVKEEKIDEIHIELGRDMKNPNEERRRINEKITANENTNKRIRAMLIEFKDMNDIESVRPYSPTQQEILKIYEEYALGILENDDPEFQFIDKIAKSSKPSKNEIVRYKCWLEQKYRSPYTGEIIPLGKLFTPAYEVEHIIPQSLLFDDSFNNKVICESEVNKLKDNQLGFEFIKNHHGEKIEVQNRQIVEVCSVDQYENFVKENYRYNKDKQRRLMMDEIPEKFIERQINDTRYITREVMRLLSNIVREKLDSGILEEEPTSKQVIPCSGKITGILKQDWGLNNVWNSIILPRFERLNKIENTTRFTATNEQGHLIPSIPFELKGSVTKKRIDHRHHALDALVIACATREHIQYLNGENSKSKNYQVQKGLARKLRKFETVEYKKRIKNDRGVWIQSEERIKKDIPREFFKPWDSFTEDARNALNKVIVSFRQNQRVINKTVNHYIKFDNGGEKIIERQIKGDSWAIRKPLHKDTTFGIVNLRKIKTVSLNEAVKNPLSIVEKDLKKKILELLKQNYDIKKIKKYFTDNADAWSDINLSKIPIYYFSKDSKEKYFAVRKPLDTSFNKSKIENSVTDTAIQKILLQHLNTNGNNPEIAFSPEGIETMNNNINILNNGKDHKQILKVRVYEKADKFAVGSTGNKSTKYVEADKGTNLFFAIYKTKNGKRTYETISLQVAIERQKQGLPSAPEMNSNGDKLLFVLSPNDLVYVPTREELDMGFNSDALEVDRIYKMISSSGRQCFFIPQNVANPIVDKSEFSALNKMERSTTGEMIKDICIRLRVDRLGEAELNELK